MILSVFYSIAQYTNPPLVSHYFPDRHVAVMHEDTLQCARKHSEEEDCKLVDMDVNTAETVFVYKKIAVSL